MNVFGCLAHGHADNPWTWVHLLPILGAGLALTLSGVVRVSGVRVCVRVCVCVCVGIVYMLGLLLIASDCFSVGPQRQQILSCVCVCVCVCERDLSRGLSSSAACLQCSNAFSTEAKLHSETKD